MNGHSRALARILRILRAHLPDLTARYPIKSLGVFGSYTRRDYTKKSDLDLLIEIDDSTPFGLFRFIHLQNELSDLLSLKVDLVERGALRGRIGENILREVVYV